MFTLTLATSADSQEDSALDYFLPLLFTGFLNLGRSLTLLVPQFPDLKNGDDNKTKLRNQQEDQMTSH